MSRKTLSIPQMIEELNKLETLRQRLLESPMSIEGTWIHEYSITRYYSSTCIHTYTYAKWQAHEPIFERKPKKVGGQISPAKAGKHPTLTQHEHIGRVGSTSGLGMDDEVERAYYEWGNRLKLEAVEAAIAKISQIVQETKHEIKQVNFFPDLDQAD